jgi:hypothetical protein
VGFILRTTGDPLNFNKVTISLWFLISSETITEAQAKFSDSNANGRQWRGVIPLLVWGLQPSGDEYPLESVLLGNEPGLGDIFGTQIGSPVSYDYGPSYIGVRCQPDEDPVLEVVIQTDQFADCTNTNAIATDYELTGPPENTYEYIYSDASSIDEDYPDYFGGVSQTVITPDVPHHLLISWDLSCGSETVGSGLEGSSAEFEDSVIASSQMWMALDGVNKTGVNLPMIWPGGDFDPNRHTSYVAGLYAGQANTPLGSAAVSLTVGTIPTDNFAIPGPATIALGGGTDAPVLRIGKADLQVFTDMSLDTSIEANLRAFISATGRRVNPSAAATLMGKQPEILFKSVSNWQSGTNQGTAGDLVPTGTITAFDMF